MMSEQFASPVFCMTRARMLATASHCGRGQSKLHARQPHHQHACLEYLVAHQRRAVEVEVHRRDSGLRPGRRRETGGDHSRLDTPGLHLGARFAGALALASGTLVFGKMRWSFALPHEATHCR
jgi:hypothetical protein